MANSEECKKVLTAILFKAPTSLAKTGKSTLMSPNGTLFNSSLLVYPVTYSENYSNI